MVTLAHQGGWDEILMVAAPLLLVAGLLLVANHRANRELARGQATDADRPRAARSPEDTPTS